MKITNAQYDIAMSLLVATSNSMGVDNSETLELKS